MRGSRVCVWMMGALVGVCAAGHSGAVRSAEAESAASLLPGRMAAPIAGIGRAVGSSAGEPGLLPRHSAAAAMRAAIAAENPSILVEAVFVLPRAKSADAPLQGPAASRAGELASIYGIVRSLSSLQGIQYYSASRKTMRTFYSESYVIDGPDTRVRMPDPGIPSPGMLPAAETLYAFQRDLSFGGNLYRYDFATHPDAVAIRCTNLTRMSYRLIPVLAPKALVTRILIVQADDAIIFYAASGARAPGVFKDKIEDSFSNRAEALFKWFSAKYARL